MTISVDLFLLSFEFYAKLTDPSRFVVRNIDKMKQFSVRFPIFSICPIFSNISMVPSTFRNTWIATRLPRLSNIFLNSLKIQIIFSRYTGEYWTSWTHSFPLTWFIARDNRLCLSQCLVAVGSCSQRYPFDRSR